MPSDWGPLAIDGSGSGALRVRSFHDGEMHVLALGGELDLFSADRVEREIRRIEPTPVHVIAIDLRELTFIDSLGVRVIRLAAQRAAQGSDRLIVLRAPPAVHRIFELCGLTAELPFVDELPSAVEPPDQPLRAAHRRRRE
jgi:anti-sigma B factor antagonist